MQLTFFSCRGWESWDVSAKPAMPEGMPVLVDDDLVFESEGVSRATVAVNRWLRELPSSGAPAAGTWAVYARVLRDWMVFCAGHGVEVFAGRERLTSVLGAYAGFRADGPLAARFAAATWNQHVSVLSCFYRWAAVEGLAVAVPFSYTQARVSYDGVAREVGVNLARRRTAKPHATIKYLEADFARLFVWALSGLGPGGESDSGYRGRELARNSAIAQLALSSGLRLREFSYLLVYEVPALMSRTAGLPVPLAVPAGVAKGGKNRTTWIERPVLEAVHRYIGLERAASVLGSSWRPPPRWGEPLMVTEADPLGGRINGRRVRWDGLRPGQRRRLVAPGGGSPVLAVRADGGPFTAWDSVFTRASDRIRERFEPRFPQVNPHRLRHSFAIVTLERLVGGYYEQAAALVAATDAGSGPDAALSLYLAKADPMTGQGLTRDLTLAGAPRASCRSAPLRPPAMRATASSPSATATSRTGASPSDSRTGHRRNWLCTCARCDLRVGEGPARVGVTLVPTTRPRLWKPDPARSAIADRRTAAITVLTAALVVGSETVHPVESR
jgi:integrase